MGVDYLWGVEKISIFLDRSSFGRVEGLGRTVSRQT